jgi:hypothetical protein
MLGLGNVSNGAVTPGAQDVWIDNNFWDDTSTWVD